MNVGAVIPPHWLYTARAPIHPKRPYGLTRPVVPPDGSFHFSTPFSGNVFNDGIKSRAARGDAALPALVPAAACNAAMLRLGLTGLGANNAVTTRVSRDA